MRIVNWTETQRKIRDHGELVTVIFDRAELRRTGDPDAATVAKVWAKFPRDGASTLRVVVWTNYSGDENRGCCYYGTAGGYGYDKLTSAIADSGAILRNGRGRLVKFRDHGGRTPSPKGPASVRWDDRAALDALNLAMLR